MTLYIALQLVLMRNAVRSSEIVLKIILTKPVSTFILQIILFHVGLFVEESHFLLSAHNF